MRLPPLKLMHSKPSSTRWKSKKRWPKNTRTCKVKSLSKSRWSSASQPRVRFVSWKTSSTTRKKMTLFQKYIGSTDTGTARSLRTQMLTSGKWCTDAVILVPKSLKLFWGTTWKSTKTICLEKTSSSSTTRYSILRTLRCRDTLSMEMTYYPSTTRSIWTFWKTTWKRERRTITATYQRILIYEQIEKMQWEPCQVNDMTQFKILDVLTMVNL